jgi:hypothetical protein
MRLWKPKSPQPFSFEAFGVQLELALESRDLEAQVREILPPGWRPCSSSEGAGQFGLRRTGVDDYEVTLGGQPWLENATLDVALGMLDAQMRLFIAANAQEWIFVHAGVVAQGGRALVIPGESFSGKTTLVTALVEAGATYYSDEYAVLDADGRVHPFPLRLSIRSNDGSSTQERHVGEIGGVAAEESAELAAVVVTRYRSGAEWKPRRLSTGQGIVALLANTVPAQERPHEALRTLRRATAGAIMIESDRGEARSVAGELLKGLATVVS